MVPILNKWKVQSRNASPIQDVTINQLINQSLYGDVERFLPPIVFRSLLYLDSGDQGSERCSRESLTGTVVLLRGEDSSNQLSAFSSWPWSAAPSASCSLVSWVEVAVLGRSSGCWDGSTTVAPRLLLQPMTGPQHSSCSADGGGSRRSSGVEDVRRNLVVLEDPQVLKTSVAAGDPALVCGAFTHYGNC